MEFEHIMRIPPYYIKNTFNQLSETIDYGLKMLNIPQWWVETKGEGIRIAVIDTIADNHPDYADGLNCTIDFTGEGITPNNNHGTLVSGIIGARQNNMGVVGVAPKCNLYSLGALSPNTGSGELSWIVNAIEWAIDNKMDIINMSFGASPRSAPELEEVTKRAADKGIILVAAAGNEGGGLNLDTVSIPARYEWVIGVGAVDPFRQRASFSSTGPLNIAAPGVDILSTSVGGGYVRASGTSFACPIITGLCALILAKHKNSKDSKTPINNTYDMLKHLERISTHLGDPSLYGIGLPNGTIIDV